MKNVDVIIAAGGTGGHIFPGLAIGQSLQKQGLKISWLGSEQGLEKDLVPKYNFELDLIPIKGIRRTNLINKLVSPFIVLKAIFIAFKIVKKRNPKILIGMGGFASFPGAIAIKMMGKKLIIHEQNSIAGKSNKILSLIADLVLMGFPKSFKNNSKKFIYSGNPIRQEINNLKFNISIENKNQTNILILGGSRGSVALNYKIIETLVRIKNELPHKYPNIWHQTGDLPFNEILKKYQNQNLTTYKIEPFIDNIAKAYSWADIIIARAGALTISEIIASKKFSILIPYPFAVDDHQTYNAMFLTNNNSANIIQQKDLTSENLLNNLEKFLIDKQNQNKILNKLEKIANNNKAIHNKDSLKNITNLILDLIN